MEAGVFSTFSVLTGFSAFSAAAFLPDSFSLSDFFTGIITSFSSGFEINGFTTFFPAVTLLATAFCFTAGAFLATVFTGCAVVFFTSCFLAGVEGALAAVAFLEGAALVTVVFLTTAFLAAGFFSLGGAAFLTVAFLAAGAAFFAGAGLAAAFFAVATFLVAATFFLTGAAFWVFLLATFFFVAMGLAFFVN
ncbi:hypothetical protein [Chitinophaga japonensis]|uniref:hypothetical protein n=1 Tax=Chitinophaga japonensis TaxID=104662 RepID=UPI001FCF1D6D|nr:hypothetical protein [Chitinophaga japonensis]